MRVTFLRHAEKQAAQGGHCGGLTPHGHGQAKAFAQRVFDLEPKTTEHAPTHLFASPKRRTQETLQPLALKYQISVVIREELQEQLCHEPSSEFLGRIREFLRFLEQELPKDSSVFVCTHMDWLQEMLCLVPSSDDRLDDILHFSPCQAISFEIDSTGLWHPEISR